MARKRKRPLYVAGIIERHDNTILIARLADRNGERSPWAFPRGIARDNESSEAAMRRVARNLLGIEVEIVVGQPPLLETIDGQSVELRFFFCGVQQDEDGATRYAEVRWIEKGHLSEYDFDDVSRPVAAWLIETRR